MEETESKAGVGLSSHGRSSCWQQAVTHPRRQGGEGRVDHCLIDADHTPHGCGFPHTAPRRVTATFLPCSNVKKHILSGVK